MSENALVSLFKTVDNIKSAIELGQSDMVIADSAKLVAQISAAVAVEGFLRTYSALEGFGRTLSLWRAGQGINGEGIVKQQALAGFVASEMVGALIDKARELNIGGWIYDLLHPPVTVSDLRTYLNNVDWIIGHEQGSDFYQDSSNYAYHPGDPDGEAEVRLTVIVSTARKWTLDVRAVGDEIWERVAEGVATPILIDINGDGIHTTNSWLHSVDFDINGDGVKDRTAWSTGEDAFLAIDINGNGKIDGVNELFGGVNRGDGFARLAEFDSNSDGTVDALDERFAELMLWQDKNADGITDEGELVNASQAGLGSVSTAYTSQDVYQNGNLLGEVSTAVWQGKTVAAIDVSFRYEAGDLPAAVDDGQNSANTGSHQNAVVSEISVDPANQVQSLISAMSTFSASGDSDAMGATAYGHATAAFMRARGHIDIAAY